MDILQFLAAISAFFLFVYYYLVNKYDFWKKLNIPGPKPILLFGNFKDVILSKVHIADYLKTIYDTYPDEPVVGAYNATSPVLIVKDLEFVKDILIKSFSDFADRGFNIHEDIDPLSQHLVFLEPKRWKPLRKKLSPVFTSGKLKGMFYLINECASHLNEYLEKLAAKGQPIECRELTAKFTTDVIGVCAFGLNMNALSDEDSEFRKIGRTMFQDTWFNRARRGSRSLPHWLAVLLKPIARNEKIINFFVNTIKSTMEYRKQNNIRRNDFVDLLMDIKDNPDKAMGEQEMSDMLLTAQAFVFFVAGFETSSTAMSHALYELALNPSIQDKLREEVKTTFEQNNGKLNYDIMKDMKYLDKVFKESLRKYPPALGLSRVALNDHTFTNSKISIPKGTKVLIPAYAIHHDPNIFKEPSKFDPDRFEEACVNARPQMSYLPFGDGPRNCIGERFAQNQSKVGLAMLIQNFKFEICEKTSTTYIKNPHATILAPKHGIYLRIKKI